MRVVTPRSEVFVDTTGWTWLQPVERSTRRRHTAGTFVLAVLVLAAMATWTLLEQPLAAIATAVVAACAALLVWRIVRGARSKVAWSALGLYVQNGGTAQQLGWAAVREVSTRPSGRRLRIVIDDGHRPTTTSADFDADSVRRWVASAREEAARRRLDPVALEDGTGFEVHRP